MFGNFNPFKEKKEAGQLNEQDKLIKRLGFTSDSVKDFARAKEIAGKISDEKTKEAILSKITETEKRETVKTAKELKTAYRKLGGLDLEIEDMRDAINSGNLKDAKSIASHLAENDENYAAKAFLEIAEAELKKGINPDKTISRTRDIAKTSEDPWHKVTIFVDIMKLEAAQELYDRAKQTATEIRDMAKNEPGWSEYDARLFMTIAETEKDIGLATDEFEGLDENTINFLVNNPNQDVIEAIQGLRQEKS